MTCIWGSLGYSDCRGGVRPSTDKSVKDEVDRPKKKRGLIEDGYEAMPRSSVLFLQFVLVRSPIAVDVRACKSCRPSRGRRDEVFDPVHLSHKFQP